MAFRKYAYAALSHRGWNPENWQAFRQRARGMSRVAAASPNLIDQASEILGETFDPNGYVLSHCTVVASVDTEDVPNVKLGAIIEGGHQINRKFSNYRITPESQLFINNNNDSFPRGVVLKSYRTFIGAHNFLEHDQREIVTKGRIIDAVARDIGPSIYVDILVATNKKHANLVRDIENGRMNALSMGCSCSHTTCTKCGHVAHDETDLCDHIRYMKGSIDFDHRSRPFKIAELCGHESDDPTGGVTFIEASWVEVPAFQGAVLRNILEPEVINLETEKQVRTVLASPPPEWTRAENDLVRAAGGIAPATFARTVVADFPPPPPPGGGGGGDAPPAEEPKDPLSGLVDDVEKLVLDKAKKRIKEKLTEDVRDQASDGEMATSTGDSLVHQGRKVAKLAEGADALIRIARSDVELLDGLARLEQSHGITVSKEVYRTALRAGSTDEHASFDKYLARCAEVLGRQPKDGEAETLVRLGRILSLSKARKRTRS